MSDLKGKKESRTGEVSKFMEFSLGDETFAIPLLTVKEVIDIPQFTPVPFTPKHFLGIMNLRGQVLSVIDLRIKMGINPSKKNNEEGVIILDLSPITLGVVVDSINSVLSLNAADISVAPEIESKMSSEYITGIYRGDNKMTIMIDISKILDSKDVKVIQNSGKSAA